MTYLIDTNIFSFYFRRNANVINNFTKKDGGNNLFMCSIVLAELYAGAELKKLDKLFNYIEVLNTRLSCLDFDKKSALEFGKIKASLRAKGLTIDSMDINIAAIAKANDLTLVTNNTKHFENIDGLRLEDWTI